MIGFGAYRIGVIARDMSEYRGMVVSDFVIQDDINVWDLEPLQERPNTVKKAYFMEQIHSNIVHKIPSTNEIYPTNEISLVTPIAPNHPTNEIHTTNETHTTTNEIYNPKCDALVSDKSNVALMCLGADCPSVVLLGSTHFGIAHAGRRGLLDGILERTIDMIQEPVLAAFISAGICKDCYDLEYFDDERYARYYQHGKLDLYGIINSKLKACKIPTYNTTLCTHCDGLYSYHHSKTHKRLATYVYKL